jgi:cytosine/adenosine deaminase-related metal-dependent hydrolase
VKPRLHKAKWVMVEPEVWIENGMVEVTSGRISAIGKAQAGAGVHDHGSGVILPALINAHTHLSLSCLSDRLRPGIGFVEWVKELIEARTAFSPQQILTAAIQAADLVRQTGTGLVAQVGPWEPGTESITRAGLEGTVFLEMLGNCPTLPDMPDNCNGVSFSYAGHALHTTAPETLRAVKAAAAKRECVCTFHLAESDAETEFLSTGAGSWADLLRSRGIDFADWDLKSERPVARAERLGLLSSGTLAVHCLDVDRTDVNVLTRSGVSICACARSNLALHGRLPLIEEFLDAGVNVALGTDSLASSPSLNLFEEMAFVADNYPGLRPEVILGMASINGAKALRRSDLGTIKPGQTAQLIFVELEADSAEGAAQQLVLSRPTGVEWL